MGTPCEWGGDQQIHVYISIIITRFINRADKYPATPSFPQNTHTYDVIGSAFKQIAEIANGPCS